MSKTWVAGSPGGSLRASVFASKKFRRRSVDETAAEGLRGCAYPNYVTNLSGDNIAHWMDANPQV